MRRRHPSVGVRDIVSPYQRPGGEWIAIGETVILLTLSLHRYWTIYERERGLQQNDRTLVNG